MNQKPTETGYYWYKEKGSQKFPRDWSPVYVYQEEHRIQFKEGIPPDDGWRVIGIGWEIETYMSLCDGEWGDRIPEPPANSAD
jgi:hypothetical protein